MLLVLLLLLQLITQSYFVCSVNNIIVPIRHILEFSGRQQQQSYKQECE